MPQLPYTKRGGFINMKKVLSCLLSFLPGVSLFLALILMLIFSINATFTNTAVDMNVSSFIFIFLMMGLCIFSVIITFTVMVLYIIRAVKLPQLSSGMKLLWVFLLYYFNVFSYPVFWFLYIKPTFNEYQQ